MMPLINQSNGKNKFAITWIIESGGLGTKTGGGGAWVIRYLHCLWVMHRFNGVHGTLLACERYECAAWNNKTHIPHDSHIQVTMDWIQIWHDFKCHKPLGLAPSSGYTHPAMTAGRGEGDGGWRERRGPYKRMINEHVSDASQKTNAGNDVEASDKTPARRRRRPDPVSDSHISCS